MGQAASGSMLRNARRNWLPDRPRVAYVPDMGSLRLLRAT